MSDVVKDYLQWAVQDLKREQAKLIADIIREEEFVNKYQTNLERYRARLDESQKNTREFLLAADQLGIDISGED